MGSKGSSGRRCPESRSVFRGLISTLLAVGLLSACAEEADLPVPAPRQPAPEFSLPLLGTGNEVSLANLRGKIVVIDFWATWCVPCEFQVPALNAFYEAHRGDSDVALFGVSIDTEGAEVVSEWVVEKDVRYPILLAGGDDLAREFGAEGFPTVVIVRGDGTIDSRHSGLIQLAELEEILVAIRNAG